VSPGSHVVSGLHTWSVVVLGWTEANETLRSQGAVIGAQTETDVSEVDRVWNVLLPSQGTLTRFIARATPGIGADESTCATSILMFPSVLLLPSYEARMRRNMSVRSERLRPPPLLAASRQLASKETRAEPGVRRR